VNSVSYIGAVFDGRYVYYVPSTLTGLSTGSGQILRFDTTQFFSQSSSYASFNAANVTGGGIGFNGGVFDGRYVYFVPATSGNTAVTRYDTTLPFGLASSYAVNTIGAGYYGGTFDPV
jgi:hypothetical protein